MRRVTAVRLCVSVLICYGALDQTLSLAQKLVDKQAILSQARQSYYNLHNEGLATFQCSVTPNWERILQEESRHDPATIDATVKTLSQLRFTTSVAANNSVKLTHNDLAEQSQQMKDALRQIYGGMEQMTSGFFESWGLFMLSTPFPEINSKYQLDTIGRQYRLTYKEGTADVVETMGRDFSITDLKVTSPEFDSSLQPTFTKTPKGLVLRGYDASYQSQKPKETTRLKVLIDYQEVQGFQMLQKLNLSGTHDGTAFALELVFSDCYVSTKPH